MPKKWKGISSLKGKLPSKGKTRSGGSSPARGKVSPAGILSSTRRSLILTLMAAGLIVLMALFGVFVLKSHGAEQPAVAIDGVDTSRSQIMVTGEGYMLNQSQGVAMEKEEEERQMQYQQQPQTQQQVGAPSTRYNQIARQYTSPYRPSYTPTYRRSTTPYRPTYTYKPQPTKEKKTKKTKTKKPSGSDTGDPADETPSDDTSSGSTDDPSDSGETPVETQGKPVITTDLTNGQTVNGEELNFYVKAKNYKGKNISQGNFTVTVNDTEIYASGSTYKALYSCKITDDSSSPLKNGKNVIKITVKDTDGNKTTATLRVTMDAEEEAEPEGMATLTITADSVGLGTIYASGDVEIYKDEKIAHFFSRVMEDAGLSYSSSGSEDNNFYLARINKEGILEGWTITDEQIDAIGKTMSEPEDMDSLGEKDFFPQSGWMFSVNGTTPDSGMASGTIQDGDEIVIWFTLDGGNDSDEEE